MRKYRPSSQQTVRAAILQDVYRDNRQPDSPERPLPSRRSRTVHRLGIVLLAALLLPVTTLFLLHSAMQEGTVPPSGAESGSANRVAEALGSGLSPFIANANAVVEVEPAVAEWGRRLDGAEEYLALLKQPDMALTDLFGLDVRTIVIDPGHGGDDPGAIGANGLEEKDVTLEIARLLYRRLLDEEGVNVVLTRDADVTLSLRQRVEFASQMGADLLISIHLNTIPNSPMTIVETYYFGAPTDAQSLKLASLENRHSEYAVADFEQLIAQFGNTLKQQESRKLAGHIQRSVYGTLRRGNHELIDAGIKSAPFVVLLGDGIPSVLAEVTCISNTDEEARLATPAYRDRIAAALERGILSYLEQLREQQRQRPEQGSNTYAESQG